MSQIICICIYTNVEESHITRNSQKTIENWLKKTIELTRPSWIKSGQVNLVQLIKIVGWARLYGHGHGHGYGQKMWV